jgi:hypothetical protein
MFYPAPLASDFKASALFEKVCRSFTLKPKSLSPLFANVRYERGVAVPSIDAAKNISDVLEVSLDHLVSEGLLNGFDKKNLQHLHDLEHLDEDKKKSLLDLIDTYIRDAKGCKACAS